MRHPLMDRPHEPVVDHARVAHDPERQGDLDEPLADDPGLNLTLGNVVEVVEQERPEEEDDHPSREPAQGGAVEHRGKQHPRPDSHQRCRIECRVGNDEGGREVAPTRGEGLIRRAVDREVVGHQPAADQPAGQEAEACIPPACRTLEGERAGDERQGERRVIPHRGRQPDRQPGPDRPAGDDGQAREQEPRPGRAVGHDGPAVKGQGRVEEHERGPERRPSQPGEAGPRR